MGPAGRVLPALFLSCPAVGCKLRTAPMPGIGAVLLYEREAALIHGRAGLRFFYPLCVFTRFGVDPYRVSLVDEHRHH